MMNYIKQYIKPIFNTLGIVLMFSSCVHDDKYNAPNSSEYRCKDLSADSQLKLISLQEVKSLYNKTAYVFDENSNLYIEGYVSSSDETGNIFKTIYIQDKAENPTQGFAISVDASNTYTHFPQGAKIYVKLAGLALGEYGGVIQLGKKLGTEAFANRVSRISEKSIADHIFKSCTEQTSIVPKVITLNELNRSDEYLGVLVKIENAEFHQSTLCNQFAPNGQTVDRRITDPTSSASSRVVRNSGYASFASKIMPSGKGDFVGILSKFNTTYQFFIVRDSDLKMNAFPRNDGITEVPCKADATAHTKTIAQIKEISNDGVLRKIEDNISLTAKVIANDETGNLYKFFYVEDETGGIRVNINMTGLHLDKRFQVGRMITINLKNLYIGKVNGEYQVGGLYQNRLGQVEAQNIYQHFFPTDYPITNVKATEKTLTTLTKNDVGKWIKIKDLQFVSEDLGKTYATGKAGTNRTLEDCNGNKIILRTNGLANFGDTKTKLPANEVEVETGKGDVYAVLSAYKDDYQLIITKLRDIDLDNPRCDGSLPNKQNTTTLFEDGFANLNAWKSVNISGAEVWNTTTFGNPKPSAIMNGNRKANEDWLIMKTPVDLRGYTDAFLSFDTDGKFEGATLEVFATDNFTESIESTTWTKLNPVLDADLKTFGKWTNSGKVSLKAFAGKKVTVAFKYLSTTGASTTWEVDNFLIKGIK